MLHSMDEAPLEQDEPRVLHVKVTNRNDFPLLDRFDSVPYEFKPNVPTSIPVDAASHIFGWHEGVDLADMQRHIIKRFGWNTPEHVKEEKDRRFVNNIEVRAVLYRLVPVMQDEVGIGDGPGTESEAVDDLPKGLRPTKPETKPEKARAPVVG